MKATIIVSIVLCLVVGGIAGWALRGITSASKAPAMINITQDDSRSSSRIAVYDSGTLMIADYNPMSDGGSVEHISKRSIK